MQKLLLSLCLLVSFSGVANGAFNRDREIRRVEDGFNEGSKLRFAEATDEAMTAWVRTSVRALHRQGRDAEAFQLFDAWEGADGWKGFLPALVDASQRGLISTREVPELYTPLSDFLADWYHVLKKLMPEATISALRLDDIQVINFSVPVVFAMHGTLGPDVTVKPGEYPVYFVPFLGVVSYWCVWGACEVATWGTGWFLICSPAGKIAERVTVKRVAPPLAPKAYRLFWG